MENPSLDLGHWAFVPFPQFWIPIDPLLDSRRSIFWAPSRRAVFSGGGRDCRIMPPQQHSLTSHHWVKLTAHALQNTLHISSGTRRSSSASSCSSLANPIIGLFRLIPTRVEWRLVDIQSLSFLGPGHVWHQWYEGNRQVCLGTPYCILFRLFQPSVASRSWLDCCVGCVAWYVC